MSTLQQIMQRAQALRKETALDSISPERAGGIMYDTLSYINQMQLLDANPILLSKIYSSVEAMEADTAPVSDITGKALRPGQVVVIVTASTSSPDYGVVYRYNGIVEGASSWTAVGKIGSDPYLSGYLYLGMATPSTDPQTENITQKVFYRATEPGTYANFGGLVVNEGEVANLKYDGTNWSKEVTGEATAAAVLQQGTELDEKISQLGQEVDNIYNQISGFVVNETVSAKYYELGFLKIGNKVKISNKGNAQITLYFRKVKGTTGQVSVEVPSNSSVEYTFEDDFVYLYLHTSATYNFSVLYYGKIYDGIKESFPIPVNDLTTGGANKYLSAEMGKQLGVEIEDIKDDIFVPEIGDEILSSRNEEGYIAGNGNIITGNSFHVYHYDISGLNHIKITNTLRAGSSFLFALYNSDTFSASSLVSTGPKASQSTEDYYIVPTQGAAYLGITYRPEVTIKAEQVNVIPVNDKVLEIDERVKVLEGGQIVSSEYYAYSFDGQNLYVAYNHKGLETLYWFKKCMANNLFTFYRVGYRSVNRSYPSVENITTDENIVVINQTGTDNIGPLSMKDGGWTGGNHRKEVESKLYYTAKCDYYNIYADGKIVGMGASGNAGHLIVSVRNTLYDPSHIPADPNADILDVFLCYEYAAYAINRNNIEVGIRHIFSEDTQNRLGTYHGMQSAFANEDYILTPNGKWTEFTSVSGLTPEIANFIKSEYPNFNRFIEKDSVNGRYQASYLYNDWALGKHEYIASDGGIFLRGDTGKDYHNIYQGNYLAPLAGRTIQWRGTYTFFDSPLVEDTNVFAYIGTIYGKDAIFINTMGEYSGNIPVPSEFMLKKMAIRECYGISDGDGGTNFQTAGNGLYIESNSTGSLILVFD